MAVALKKTVYEIMETSVQEDWRGRWFDRFMMVLIVTNVAAVVFETVEQLVVRLDTFFTVFEIFSVFVFTVEYVLRLWVCTEDDSELYRHPIHGRLKYAVTPAALIDLLAIAPFYLSVFFTIDLRFLRVFRLLRLLKLTRYSQAMEAFATVIRSEIRGLGAALLIIIMLLVFSSSIVFLLEREAQPEIFASIPHSMWWALATLTTVGYGDVTPITAGGRIFGAVVMVLGIGMFALPTGILASGFSREIRKREFVATWRLVANNPLFANLNALQISEIAGLLHAKKVPPNYTIIRKGDHADFMCFIVSGEVQIHIPPGATRLGAGEFFGEIALLTDTARTATVTAATECQLLILDVRDFQRLLAAVPEIGESLTDAMEQRLKYLRKSSELI